MYRMCVRACVCAGRQACVCACVSAGMCACMLSTTHFILLNQFGQHDNDGCLVFPHHLPEVIQCVWGGAWGRGMQERTLNP